MLYEREKNIIRNTETGETITYKYINEAKRASRKLQSEGNKVRKLS